MVSSVQSLSRVQLFATPRTAARQASLSITNSRSLLKLTSIELVMPANRLILCCPLLLPLSIFPGIRVFFNASVLCIRWTKYWNFSFSISPSNEYSGLISFRMGWLDLLAVQGTLKSLLHTTQDEFISTPIRQSLKSLSRGLNRVQSCTLSRWSQRCMTCKAVTLKTAPIVRTVGRR